MKKFSLFAFLSMVLFSLTVLSCKKDDDGDNSDDPNNLKTGHVEIKGYASEKDKKISFYATAKTITIDWGDGKIDEITPNGVEKEFVHEYDKSSDFQTILVKTEDLTEIDFDDSDGSIHELRFGNCPKLQEISCSSSNLTQLTVFEINKAESLTVLEIGGSGSMYYSTKLTSLDLSKCTALTELDCRYNQFTSLDISKCTALVELNCSYNQLDAAALNSVFNSLPAGKEYEDSSGWSRTSTISIWYNPGSNDCDTSIAENKGWRIN